MAGDDTRSALGQARLPIPDVERKLSGPEACEVAAGSLVLDWREES